MISESKNGTVIITADDQLTVQGGQIKGRGIIINADNLHIASIQDTATYASKQQNIFGQASISIDASINANYNQSKINADYKSVTKQSGVFAGDDGFNVKVKNHSQLDGAVINSTKAAKEQGKNRFSTATINTTALKKP